ncbi:hypothetical protein GCM10011594_18090 [Nakamurella endophytica]|uniref:Uncharacterized protein n=1 Tax=Nakamurella endophytica TaxID=1748367 RepID=A0A917SUT3_9ACTN|nr:hypothetical protein GCM10011594_18090 [Nakamurella endophytica]
MTAALLLCACPGVAVGSWLPRDGAPPPVAFATTFTAAAAIGAVLGVTWIVVLTVHPEWERRPVRPVSPWLTFGLAAAVVVSAACVLTAVVDGRSGWAVTSAMAPVLASSGWRSWLQAHSTAPTGK